MKSNTPNDKNPKKIMHKRTVPEFEKNYLRQSNVQYHIKWGNTEIISSKITSIFSFILHSTQNISQRNQAGERKERKERNQL